MFKSEYEELDDDLDGINQPSSGPPMISDVESGQSPRPPPPETFSRTACPGQLCQPDMTTEANLARIRRPIEMDDTTRYRFQLFWVCGFITCILIGIIGAINQ